MRKSGLTSLSVAATPFLLLLVAGCGAVSCPCGHRAPGALVISAEKATIDTTPTDQLSARLASGASARVKWTIAGGQNDASLGQGTISANGALYAAALCFPEIRCRSRSWRPPADDPAATATICSPLPPASSRCLRRKPPAWRPEEPFRSQGEIAEVNSGSIRWSLATTAGGEIDPGDSYGSIGETRCSHSNRTYTSCTATYTAPRALPRAALLFLSWGLPQEIPTPPRRCTFC